jgi:Cytochrome P450
MVLFPDVALKAQNEIDAVVGSERLPTFEDRPQLPYIDALVKEVLRWNSVTPLGEETPFLANNVYSRALPLLQVVLIGVQKMMCMRVISFRMGQ